MIHQKIIIVMDIPLHEETYYQFFVCHVQYLFLHMGKPFTLSDSICATFEVIVDLIQDRTSTNVIELLASGANRSLLRHIAQ